MCSCGIAGARVVVLSTPSCRFLLERGRLSGSAVFSVPRTAASSSSSSYGREASYLIDGHRAGIVLVVALEVHQFCRQCIFPAIAGRAWCRRGWQIMAVEVERSRRLALGAFTSHIRRRRLVYRLYSEGGWRMWAAVFTCRGESIYSRTVAQLAAIGCQRPRFIWAIGGMTLWERKRRERKYYSKTSARYLGPALTPGVTAAIAPLPAVLVGSCVGSSTHSSAHRSSTPDFLSRFETRKVKGILQHEDTCLLITLKVLGALLSIGTYTVASSVVELSFRNCGLLLSIIPHLLFYPTDCACTTVDERCVDLRDTSSGIKNFACLSSVGDTSSSEDYFTWVLGCGCRYWRRLECKGRRRLLEVVYIGRQCW
jgi:hypothetical protein